MSFLKRTRFWNRMIICLTICFIWGCTQPIQQRGTSTLSSIEGIEESIDTQTEKGEETPSEIDVAKIDSTVTKKTYQGIEGEFLETPMLKDCHFEFDRYELTMQARRILAENAKILKKMSFSKVQIEGHCDERGTREYNLALGERRATSVKNYLASLGIPEKHISTISYGEEMPVDPSHNEAAWAKNRRAHIIILSRN